ncbi:MAG: hypothetical protein ABEI07_02340 [Candidatus Nanohaloarchaea archaeon]
MIEDQPTEEQVEKISQPDFGEDEVYRIEDGEKTYDEFFNAVKVAEAKAEEEDSPVRIFRKLLRTFEPVARIHPDGEQERLD